MPRAGFTYRVFDNGQEVEHFHCVRVHGRRIYFGMTAYSSLLTMTTRLRWRKMADALAEAGATIAEEPTP